MVGKTELRRWLFVGCLILFAWPGGFISEGRAQVAVYRDEQAYLDALQSQGFTAASDDLENTDQWGLMQIFSASGVTSQGVEWSSLGTGISLSNPVRRSGDWGLTPNPESTPFNGLVGSNRGNQTMYAMGGWVRGGSNNGNPTDVFLYLNGDHTQNWLDDSVTTTHSFFGVISATPISSFEFSTQEVSPGDPPKSIYLDDFTFGFDSAPTNREPGVSWTNAAGGTFDAGANWSGGNMPAATENARFDLQAVSPYTVTWTLNQTLNQAIVGSDQLAFDLGGNTLTLSETNITHESLIVGEAAGDVAALVVTQGTLSGGSAVVAHSNASNGHLVIDNGGQLNMTGHLRVGSGGTGRLDIVNGGTAASDFSAIGMFGGSGMVAVDGSGSNWDAGSTLNVGMAGTGQLTVTNGGRVSVQNLGISVKLGNGLASDSAGAGTVAIDGGELSITNNGSVTIGADGGIGSLTMNGANWTGGGAAFVAYVGRGGTGTLTLQNGTNASNISIIAGDGSTATGSSAVGHGTVFIDGGTTVVNGSSVTIGKIGASSIELTGGARINGSFATIGVGNDAQATVSGAGTEWVLTGGFYAHSKFSVGAGDQVGSFFSTDAVYKTGTLTLNGGATISTNDLFVGETRTGLGRMTVSGTGTTLITGPSFKSDAYIGCHGDGVLDIVNGGHWQSQRVFVGRFGVRNIGAYGAPVDQLRGEVNVTGFGSNWTADTDVYVGFNNDGNTYNAGSIFFSEGIVNITQGATASARSLNLGIRRLSRGILNVDGAGSVYSVGSFGVLVGALETFTNGNASFEGTGSIHVSNGGRLDVAGDVVLRAGLADLDNGTIAANTLFLDSDGYVDGTSSQLLGEGLVQADVNSAGGIIAPGHSAGTLVIDGNLTQTATGILQMEIGGLQQGAEYDFLDVSGAAILDGSLEIALLNGFLPQVGDTFDVLTAATIDATGLALTGPNQWDWQITAGGNGQVLRLTAAAIPEPSPWLLLGVAFMAIGLKRPRRTGHP